MTASQEAVAGLQRATQADARAKEDPAQAPLAAEAYAAAVPLVKAALAEDNTANVQAALEQKLAEVEQRLAAL
eukprot:COSAG04_NODE_11603_length_699_cov_1.150000_1_plen_72_part_10